MTDSSPHRSPRAAEHARELIAFKGEPKVIGQWFASARSMARDYLDAVDEIERLEEQLEALQRAAAVLAEAAKPFAVVSGRPDAYVQSGYALIAALDAFDVVASTPAKRQDD
jgi:beta-phosphoglucomutase-like phosphatase (HAD superfamily)